MSDTEVHTDTEIHDNTDKMSDIQVHQTDDNSQVSEAGAEVILIYHPAYAYADADIVFKASDGVCFKVHTFIMRLASKFFDTMLDLPQNPDSDVEAIPLGEPSGTIEAMLDIVYPNRAMPCISLFEIALKLLEVSEKYDIQSIRDSVWSLVTTPPFHCGPLEKFVLACRYGSEEEAKVASTATLEINLYRPEAVEVLRLLDNANHLKLRLLHLGRRRKLLTAMDINHAWIYGNTRHDLRIQLYSSVTRHYQSCLLAFNPPAWLALKYLVSSEMDKCSAGTTLRGNFWDRQEFQEVWTTCCDACQKAVLEKRVFISEFMRVLDLLPQTIDSE